MSFELPGVGGADKPMGLETGGVRIRSGRKGVVYPGAV